MNEELLNLYFYDQNTKAYTHSGVIEPENSIPANATTIPPIVKLSDTTAREMSNPFWNVTIGEWEEHDPQVLAQRTIMQQAQQITLLQSTVMRQDQLSAKLQAANKQQASQIEQLQHLFMQANQQQAVEKAKEATAQ